MPVGSRGLSKAKFSEALGEELLTKVLNKESLLKSPTVRELYAEVNSLRVYKEKLYASLGETSGKIYVYDGDVWKVAFTADWTPDAEGWYFTTWSSIIFGDTLYFLGYLYGAPKGIAGGGGGFISFNGTTWSYGVIDANGMAEFFTAAEYGGNLYAGNNNGDVWRLDAPGGSWTKVYTVPTQRITSMVTLRNRLYVARGFYIFAEPTAAPVAELYEFDGSTWTTYTLAGEVGIEAMTAFDDLLVVACPSGNIYYFSAGVFTQWTRATLDAHPIRGKSGRTLTTWMVARRPFSYGGTQFQGSGGALYVIDRNGYRNCVVRLPYGVSDYDIFNDEIWVASCFHKSWFHRSVARLSQILKEDGDLVWIPWHNATIGANAETYPMPVMNLEKKNVYFLSDTNGTLTIYVDPFEHGDWVVLDTLNVVANTLKSYLTLYDMHYLKLRFSAAAQVSAWVVAQ